MLSQSRRAANSRPSIPSTRTSSRIRTAFMRDLQGVGPCASGMPPARRCPGAGTSCVTTMPASCLKTRASVSKSRAPSRRSFFRRYPSPFRPFFEMTADWLIFRDPPDHTLAQAGRRGPHPQEGRADGAAHPRGGPRAAGPAARDSGPSLDVIGDYAASLPVIIIAELLGMLVDNREQLHAWSKAILAGINLRQSD